MDIGWLPSRSFTRRESIFASAVLILVLARHCRNVLTHDSQWTIIARVVFQKPPATTGIFPRPRESPRSPRILLFSARFFRPPAVGPILRDAIVELPSLYPILSQLLRFPLQVILARLLLSLADERRTVLEMDVAHVFEIAA